jgi:hypothetical protein
MVQMPDTVTLADVLDWADANVDVLLRAHAEHKPVESWNVLRAEMIRNGLRAHFQLTRHLARWPSAEGPPPYRCRLCHRESQAKDRECYPLAADPAATPRQADVDLARELKGARYFLAAATLSMPKRELRINDDAFNDLEAQDALVVGRDELRKQTVITVQGPSRQRKP